MNKFRTFLICVMFVCFSGSKVYASNWVFYEKSKTGIIFSYDLNSLQKNNNIVIVWSRAEYPKNSTKKIKSATDQIEINCITKTSQINYTNTYFTNGENEGFNFTNTAKNDPIAPDTISWSLMVEVCK